MKILEEYLKKIQGESVFPIDSPASGKPLKVQCPENKMTKLLSDIQNVIGGNPKN